MSGWAALKELEAAERATFGSPDLEKALTAFARWKGITFEEPVAREAAERRLMELLPRVAGELGRLGVGGERLVDGLKELAEQRGLLGPSRHVPLIAGRKASALDAVEDDRDDEEER